MTSTTIPDPRTVQALIETVENQAEGREAGCLTMLAERVLVAEVKRLRERVAELEASAELAERCRSVFVGIQAPRLA